jgi:hypothetical protein
MILLFLACGSDPPPPPPLPPPAVSAPAFSMESVKEAASIANAIQREPQRADQILQNNGTTRQEYEAMLYDIAIDPAQAQAYAKLRSR